MTETTSFPSQYALTPHILLAILLQKYKDILYYPRNQTVIFLFLCSYMH